MTEIYITPFRSGLGSGADGNISSDYGQHGPTIFIDSATGTINHRDPGFKNEFYFRYMFTPTASVTFELAKIGTIVELGHSLIIFNLAAVSSGFSITVEEDSGTTVTTLPPRSMCLLTAYIDGTPDRWAVATMLANVIPVNYVYVDHVYGDDTTGTRDRYDLPFKTLAAADTAAVAGDVFFVRPGAYTLSSTLTTTGTNVSGSNTTWFFAPGAIVTYSATALSGAMDVYGHAEFISSPVNNIVRLFSEGGGTFECNRVEEGRIVTTTATSLITLRIYDMDESTISLTSAADVGIHLKRIQFASETTGITVSTTGELTLNVMYAINADASLSTGTSVVSKYEQLEDSRITTSGFDSSTISVNRVLNSTRSITIITQSTIADSAMVEVNDAELLNTSTLFDLGASSAEVYSVYINSLIGGRLIAATNAQLSIKFNYIAETVSVAGTTLTFPNYTLKGNYMNAANDTLNFLNSTIDFDINNLVVASAITFKLEDCISRMRFHELDGLLNTIDSDIVMEASNMLGRCEFDGGNVRVRSHLAELLSLAPATQGQFILGTSTENLDVTLDIMRAHLTLSGATGTTNGLVAIDSGSTTGTVTLHSNIRYALAPNCPCYNLSTAGTLTLDANINTDESIAQATTGSTTACVYADPMNTGSNVRFAGRFRCASGSPISFGNFTSTTIIFHRLSAIGGATAAAGVNYTAGTGITIQHQGDTLSQLAFTGTITNVGSPVITNAALT